jgi:hypothetical protein
LTGGGNLKGMTQNKVKHNFIGLLSVLILVCGASRGQSTSPPVDPKSVPVIDGGIGTCSVDFTVTDSAGAPVYAAKIKVHIAYGFLNARKLDLEVGTNAEGKARFTGLPDRLKHGGLYFEASEGDRSGEVFDDPAKTCKAQFTVVLRRREGA